MENYFPSDFERKIAVIIDSIKKRTSKLFYKTIKNQVFNLRGLRNGSYISLNDIIRTREPNMAGRDPEPLTEYWISPKDYAWEVETRGQNQNGHLKINYRCKIDYIAKNKAEQGTAFVVSSATIKEGLIRTREPRILLVPLYYLARIVSGFHHP